MANFAVTIALVSASALAAIYSSETSLRMLSVDADFAPNLVLADGVSKRPWIVNPMGIEKDFPAWGIAYAILPVACSRGNVDSKSHKTLDMNSKGGPVFRRPFFGRLFFCGRPFVLAQERKKRHLCGEKGPQSAGRKEKRSDEHMEREQEVQESVGKSGMRQGGKGDGAQSAGKKEGKKARKDDKDGNHTWRDRGNCRRARPQERKKETTALAHVFYVYVVFWGGGSFLVWLDFLVFWFQGSRREENTGRSYC